MNFLQEKADADRKVGSLPKGCLLLTILICALIYIALTIHAQYRALEREAERARELEIQLKRYKEMKEKDFIK